MIRHAAEKSDFLVIHGLRTLEEEEAAVTAGHSQTMHSRHFRALSGFGCAVDLAVLVDGHISWAATDYLPLGDIVKASAKGLNIPVEWGGDWKSLKDWGHFQLPWKDYP